MKTKNSMYDALTDCTSIVFKKLQSMTNKAAALKAEAERIEQVNKMLVYLIQKGKLNDIEDIDCAISWLEHSQLSAEQILDNLSM